MTDQTPTEAPDYLHATPGRTLSALAYRLLSQDYWPVYVSTERNYTTYRRTDAPTDPGDTISGSAHFRPVSTWHPLSPARHPASSTTESLWDRIAEYLDDRVSTGSMSGTFNGPGTQINVEFVYDEYFIHVSGPNGNNMVEWGDYSGSTWTRSNHRSLLRDYPGVFVEISYAFGGQGLAIPLFVEAEAPSVFQPVRTIGYEFPCHEAHYDAEAAGALAEILSGLAHDYPIYDEEDHSHLERELQQVAVEQDHFRSELLDDISEAVKTALFAKLDAVAGRTEGDLTEQQQAARNEVADILREMYDASTTIVDPDGPWLVASPGYHTITSLFLTMANDNFGPEFETADSDGVVWPQYNDTIEKMAKHLIGDTK